jgi:hypothetical protein
MTGPSYAVHTRGFAEVCRVKCVDPDFLLYQPALQLGVRVKGRTARFEVCGQGGIVAPKNKFAVKYTTR